MILSSVAFAIEGFTPAYYQAQRDYLGIAPRIVIPDTLDALREEFDEWGASPPTRARYLVSEGDSGSDAIRGAATRVSKLTSGATRHVEQTALDDLFDQITGQLIYEFDEDRPDQIFAPADNDGVAALHDELSRTYRMSKKGKGALMYKRVTTSAKPCGWCQAQATRLLTAETKRKDRKWHTHCQCTWREVTAAESRAWQPIRAPSSRRCYRSDQGQSRKERRMAERDTDTNRAGRGW